MNTVKKLTKLRPLRPSVMFSAPPPIQSFRSWWQYICLDFICEAEWIVCWSRYVTDYHMSRRVTGTCEKLKSGKSLALTAVLYRTLFVWDVKKTKLELKQTKRNWVVTRCRKWQQQVTLFYSSRLSGFNELAGRPPSHQIAKDSISKISSKRNNKGL